ncbi:MAG TPA: hypothetical protein VFL70_04120 [Bacteroidia bacterium]|nr:hypothetical protein [Bacteroidia bacterium]
MVRIRAFRAINDTLSCEKFAEGHRQVLISYGINQVTSSKLDWLSNPEVYVILVESLIDGEILGGTRIHVANHTHPLPMEEALGKMDEKVYTLVKQYSSRGTGELCGLWTTRETSGKGISILLTEAGVAEAGIALAQQLKLNSIFVLCAPWTVAMAKNAGFIIEDSVGDKGTFPYPKPDLLATLLTIHDIETLEAATPDERERIYDLRNNPKQIKIENGPKGILEIEYDLLVKTPN